MIFYKLQDLNKYNEWTYFHFPHITFINLLNYQYPGLVLILSATWVIQDQSIWWSVNNECEMI